MFQQKHESIRHNTNFNKRSIEKDEECHSAFFLEKMNWALSDMDDQMLSFRPEIQKKSSKNVIPSIQDFNHASTILETKEILMMLK